MFKKLKGLDFWLSFVLCFFWIMGTMEISARNFDYLLGGVVFIIASLVGVFIIVTLTWGWIPNFWKDDLNKMED